MKYATLTISCLMLCACASGGPADPRVLQQDAVPLPHGIPMPNPVPEEEEDLPPPETEPSPVDVCAADSSVPEVNFATGSVRALYKIDDVEQQASGRIIYTGEGLSRVTVCAVHPDGSRDPSFGSACGCAYVDQPTSIQELVTDENGIFAITSWWSSGLLIVRFTPDGSLDAAFGEDGLVEVSLGEFTLGEAVVAGGKLTIAGRLGSYADGRALLVRLNSDGSLDSTFGTEGRAFLPERGISDLVVLSGERLVALTANKLHALGPSGALDVTFGEGGVVALPLPQLQTMTRAPDGGVLVSGKGMAVVRVSSTGTVLASYPALEPGSLSDGLQLSAYATDIAVTLDGRMVLGGTLATDDFYFGIGRRLADGGADLSFGPGGTKRFQGDAQSYDVEVLQDGSYLLAGTRSYDAGLIRQVW